MTIETMAPDAAIAALWPKDWARANDSRFKGRSKARNHLRKRFAEHVAFHAFKQANPTANCGGCAHYGRMPVSRHRTCELDSDFEGYAITTADKVCRRWEARKGPDHGRG